MILKNRLAKVSNDWLGMINYAYANFQLLQGKF